MRVAVVAESFLPEVNGVTNSVLRVLEHLQRRGHEAVVLAPGPGPGRHGPWGVVRAPSLPLPFYRSLRVGLPARLVHDTLARWAPDVVHLAGPVVLGASGAASSRRLGIPSVAVYQTDLAGFARRYGFGAASRPTWAWLRQVHRQVDRTLAPSSSAAWDLAIHGVPRVERWGRGVDLARFHPGHRSELLRRRLAPGGEVIVGYVGRLAREKRVEHLAHLNGLAGAVVVVVGDGPRRQALQRRLRGATFTGFRQGAELSQLVASLDVFVHPGPNETFCQAVQEALAAGVPVVAPAAGGPVDLVAHGQVGYLFPPEQPRAMREAVAELVGDPQARARMGTAARASVLARSWEALGDELLDHYAAVSGRRARLPVRAA